MAEYPRDPNALATLLKLSQQPGSSGSIATARRPELYGSDAPLYDMVDPNSPELYAEQASPEGAGLSRESLQRSAVSKLKALFGMKQLETQAKILPEQIKGQYGLQGETMKLEAAKAAAHEKDLEFQQHREEQQRFQAGQNELTRNAVAGRQQTGIAATAAGHTGTANDVLVRQQIADLDRQLMGLRAPGNKQVQAPRPAGESFFGRMVTGPNQETLNRDLIAQLEAKKASLVGGGQTIHPAIQSWAEKVRANGWNAQQLQQAAPSMPPDIIAQVLAMAGGQ